MSSLQGQNVNDIRTLIGQCVKESGGTLERFVKDAANAYAPKLKPKDIERALQRFLANERNAAPAWLKKYALEMKKKKEEQQSQGQPQYAAIRRSPPAQYAM